LPPQSGAEDFNQQEKQRQEKEKEQKEWFKLKERKKTEKK
jgi:hypothetical protein